MTDDEDISILKRKIVAVDKLVRAKQKVETKNAELSASLEAKEKELEEARVIKEQDHQKQLAEKMREIAELKAQLARAESSNSNAMAIIVLIFQVAQIFYYLHLLQHLVKEKRSRKL